MEYTRGFYEERRSLLLKQPDAINTVSDCKHWGAYASRYIAEAQETIRLYSGTSHIMTNHTSRASSENSSSQTEADLTGTD